MSCRVLDYEPFVSDNAFEDMRFFDRPFTNICPILIRFRILFLGVRGCPSRCPIVGELFEKGCIDFQRLDQTVNEIVLLEGMKEASSATSLTNVLTVNVGFSTGDEVEDSGASTSSAQTRPRKSAEE